MFFFEFPEQVLRKNVINVLGLLDLLVHLRNLQDHLDHLGHLVQREAGRRLGIRCSHRSTLHAKWSESSSCAAGLPTQVAN